MYSQFEELESFARFGTQLDDETRAKLVRGERVREVLKQREHEHLSVPDQVAALLAATEGLFDDIAPDDVAEAEGKVRRAVRDGLPDIAERIASGERLEEEDRQTLLRRMRQALGQDGTAADGDA